MAIKHYAILYAVGAFLTCGWVAADPCPDPAWGKTGCGTSIDSFGAAYFSMLLWPIYWNYKLFEQVRKP
jgi:hypothetical protein